jgi:ABC-type arginine transport system ATPase subunit
MELAIREAGASRMLLAAAASAVTKPLGIRGVFYKVVGNYINAIDGPCDYTLPPYNEYAKLGPAKPHEVAKNIKAAIGMVFQAFYLIPSLNIIDNVVLPKVFRGEAPKERREIGYQLLRRFGIAEQADKFPNQLSGRRLVRWCLRTRQQVVFCLSTSEIQYFLGIGTW